MGCVDRKARDRDERFICEVHCCGHYQKIVCMHSRNFVSSSSFSQLLIYLSTRQFAHIKCLYRLLPFRSIADVASCFCLPCRHFVDTIKKIRCESYTLQAVILITIVNRMLPMSLLSDSRPRIEAVSVLFQERNQVILFLQL